MTDLIDDANATAELMTDVALRQHQDRASQHQVWKDGKAYCTECGFAIPPERLAALPGCGRCVGCQQAIEQESRLWR
ncbi:MAG: TraR/DksA C4-type zinc finger protein [Methylobacter sp.]|nr:TraR/DksA C4-type zinc finger protein [Methylobacter sp.]